MLGVSSYVTCFPSLSCKIYFTLFVYALPSISLFLSFILCYFFQRPILNISPIALTKTSTSSANQNNQIIKEKEVESDARGRTVPHIALALLIKKKKAKPPK